MRFNPVFILVLVLLSTTSCALFGKPDYCTKTRQGNFKSFLEEDWRTYCAEFEEKTSAVANYQLTELTRFYGNHPARIEDLKSEMIRFEDPEACFTEPRERLELRSLNNCLQDDSEQQLQIINAWKARAQPWLEGVKLTIQSNKPKISDVRRESRRLQKKAAEAFDFNSEMDPADYEKFRADLAQLEKSVAAASNAQRSFRELLQLAAGNSSLTNAMQAEYGPAFAELGRDIDDQRQDIEELNEDARYLEFAVNSAGKPCPKGIRARSELRAAKKALGSQVSSIDRRTRDIRISSAIVPEERGPVQYERFEGFVCGKRSEENQFAEKPPQCGIYRFMLERTKGFDDRRWEPWQVKGWQESGP